MDHSKLDFVIVVDPGVSGGMAVWFPNAPFDFPSIVLRKYTTEEAFIELVQDTINGVDIRNIGRKGWSVVEDVPKYIGNDMMASHSFTLGYNYGFEVGVLRTSGLPVTLIRPQKWQAPFSDLRGKKGHPRKKLLKEHALRLYPDLKVTLATADALLILDHHVQGLSRR
jgi:hypothetical protein